MASLLTKSIWKKIVYLKGNLSRMRLYESEFCNTSAAAAEFCSWQQKMQLFCECHLIWSKAMKLFLKNIEYHFKCRHFSYNMKLFMHLKHRYAVAVVVAGAGVVAAAGAAGRWFFGQPISVSRPQLRAMTSSNVAVSPHTHHHHHHLHHLHSHQTYTLSQSRHNCYSGAFKRKSANAREDKIKSALNQWEENVACVLCSRRRHLGWWFFVIILQW